MSSFASSSNVKTKAPLVDEPATNEEEMAPQWVQVLLRTIFWDPCTRGHTLQNRAEGCLFCLQCYEVFCPHCTHDEPGHFLLKIRRYVYRSVVLAKEMYELNIDVSRIQPYIINGQKAVYLRPMRRSEQSKVPAGSPLCLTCNCWLHTQPNLFCSITCKVKANVSQDDYSGPEAEQRYRSLQSHLVPPLLAKKHLMPKPVPTEFEPELDLEPETESEYEHEPEPEPKFESNPELGHDHKVKTTPQEQMDSLPPAAAAVVKQHHLNNGSLRMKPRKQAEPHRAPFF